MMKIGSISADYDEPDTSTYRGIKTYIRVNGNKEIEKLFFTGDFEKDKDEAIQWLVDEGCITIMGSSTIDHFYQDSPDEI